MDVYPVVGRLWHRAAAKPKAVVTVRVSYEQDYHIGSAMVEHPTRYGYAVTFSQSVYHHRDRRQQDRIVTPIARSLGYPPGAVGVTVPVEYELQQRIPVRAARVGDHHHRGQHRRGHGRVWPPLRENLVRLDGLHRQLRQTPIPHAAPRPGMQRLVWHPEPP